MTISKNAMNYGAISGLILLTSFIVSSSLGQSDTMQKAGQWTGYLVMIIFIWIGTKTFRDKHSEGYIKYGTALWSGVQIAFFGSIIVAFGVFLYLKFVDSSLIDKILQQAENNMIEKGTSEDQIEIGMKYTRMFTTPTMMTFFVILGNTFMGTIFSLIIAAFLKKEDPNFNNFIAENN